MMENAWISDRFQGDSTHSKPKRLHFAQLRQPFSLLHRHLAILAAVQDHHLFTDLKSPIYQAEPTENEVEKDLFQAMSTSKTSASSCSASQERPTIEALSFCATAAIRCSESKRMAPKGHSKRLRRPSLVAVQLLGVKSAAAALGTERNGAWQDIIHMHI